MAMLYLCDDSEGREMIEWMLVAANQGRSACYMEDAAKWLKTITESKSWEHHFDIPMVYAEAVNDAIKHCTESMKKHGADFESYVQTDPMNLPHREY